MKAISHLAERLRTETAVIMSQELYESIAAELLALRTVAVAARALRLHAIIYDEDWWEEWEALVAALGALAALLADAGEKGE